MGESRQELLAWLNNLLQLNVTRVEQCGTGAAFCQVFDSIFLDVPMSRVKFNVNTEYAYLQNFKILQNTFAKHQIDKPVPVEALIKCKMQDNLEFLQFSKRYWDQYYPGGEYDAVARRKASGAPPAAGPRASSGNARRPAAATSTAPRTRTPGSGGATGPAAAALRQENEVLKETVAGLERERDFYFSKLRDIELLIQQAIEQEPELEKDDNSLLKQIQTILYSTEVGVHTVDWGAAGDVKVEMEKGARELGSVRECADGNSDTVALQRQDFAIVVGGDGDVPCPDKQHRLKCSRESRLREGFEIPAEGDGELEEETF